MKKMKKLLVLGLLLAYVCTAAACSGNHQADENSGSNDGVLGDVKDALDNAADDIGDAASDALR